MRGTDPQAAGRLRDRHRGEHTHPDLSDPGKQLAHRSDLCRARGGHQVAAWSSARSEGPLPRPAPALPWQTSLPQAPAAQMEAGATSSPASPARRAGRGWCRGSCRTRTPAPGRDLEAMKPGARGGGGSGGDTQQPCPAGPVPSSTDGGAHRSDVGSWQPSGCRSSTGAPLRSRRGPPRWPV